MVFAPTDIAGCTGWVASDKLTGLANNDPVTTLTNFGSANNFTGSGAGRFTYKTNIVNGLPALDLAGAQKMTSSSAASAFITASAFTIFAVIYPRTASATNPATYNDNGVIGDTGGYVGLYLKNTPQAMAYVWDGSDKHADRPISLNAWSILEIRLDAGNLYARVNGGTEVSVASGNVGSITSTFEIGHGSGLYFDGYIAEIVSYNSALSSTDRTSVRNYLTRWTLSAVGTSVQAVWNVKVLAGKSLSALWNVQALVSKSLSTIWSVKSVTTNSLNVIWHVKTSVGNNISAPWNVKALAQTNLNGQWKVRAIVNSQLVVIWSARKLVISFLTANWSVLIVYKADFTVQGIYVVPSVSNIYKIPKISGILCAPSAHRTVDA